MAIHVTGASSGPDGLLAALALRASLRLFDALRALVPRYARNDRIPMVHSLRSFRANHVIVSSKLRQLPKRI